MSDTPPFVSVIIPVLNDDARLALCLDALERQTYPPDRYEVLVIDNGSDEPIDPLVARFAHGRAAREARRGSYAARNRGIELARGEVIAFTDSDCIPDPAWIECGVQALKRVPDCGLVAGGIKLLYRDPARPTASERYESLMAFPQELYLRTAQFGVTANLFTWRKVIDDVGPFNADFESNGDRDWGQRVYKAGYAQLYAPEAFVWHPARASLGELMRKSRRVIRGDVQLKRRNGHTTGVLRRDLWREWTPPLRRTWDMLNNASLGPLGARLQVVGVLWIVRYTRAWERLRLWRRFRGG